MHLKIRTSLCILLALSACFTGAAPVGTAFTYSGLLTVGTNKADGYYDLQFRLFTTASGGTAVSSALTNAAVPVANGLFNTTLDFGAGVFNGTAYWLEMGVRTNGSGPFTVLSPRREMTPIPYALHATEVSAAGISGTIADSLLSSNIARLNSSASFSGDVSATGDLQGRRLNVGVDNSLLADYSAISGGAANRIVGPTYSTIGGGLQNQIDATKNLVEVSHDTIGGGYSNAVSSASSSVVAGGSFNRILGDINADVIYGSSIGGGNNNVMETWDEVMYQATIGGGGDNRIAKSSYATIGGGRANYIGPYGDRATIGGGASNQISATADGATISGGIGNFLSPFSMVTTISGGAANRIVRSSYSIIGGGSSNEITAGEVQGLNHDTIGGGTANRIDRASYATIGGGRGNEIQDSGYQATISGGASNTVQAAADAATIAGGIGNFVGAVSKYATISGGAANFIASESAGATVVGGLGNRASHHEFSSYASILGGQSNEVTGVFGAIAGGKLNLATNYSLAAGTRAKAVHPGSFVWASGNTNDYPSFTSNRAHFYVSGGLEVEYGGQDTNGRGHKWLVLASGTPGRVITVFNGAYLSEGGAWTDTSDRNAKENFESVNPQEVLERVVSLPLTTWNYRAEDKSVKHLGPVAQDFHTAFGLGPDDKHIAGLDSGGVALAAIQGLNQKLAGKQAEIDQLKQRLEALGRLETQNAALTQSVAELKSLVNSLLQKANGGAQ